MNSELAKIDTYLASNGFYHATYTQLSNDKGVSLISSTSSEAYNFDSITGFHFPRCSELPRSADALLLKDNLYLIEFKNGKVFDCKNSKKIKNQIKRKMSDSLHIIRHCLEDHLHCVQNYEKFFVLVFSSVKNPTFAYSAVASSLSICNNQFLSPFHSIDRNGVSPFYKETYLLNETNFLTKIASFS